MGRGWVVAGVAAYLTGYGLLIAAAALPGVGTGAVGALSGFLLAAGTVELAVLWGSYMAAYDLRQALLWCALSVGCAALVGLLLSSTTFGVGLIVFVVLVLASFPVPCLAAWKRPRGGARREIWAAGPRRLVRHHPCRRRRNLRPPRAGRGWRLWPRCPACRWRASWCSPS